MFSPTSIVAYLALFTAVGLAFLFVNLLVGRLVRPQLPNTEKLEIYECGEPTIGSSFVQFDLRFYVVALLFIIFDVEVAFFFPWAAVYGKVTNLMDRNLAVVEVLEDGSASNTLSPAVVETYKELGITQTTGTTEVVRESARTAALLSLCDIGAFFAVLMVGFAYVWRRGDLDWVRAVSRERASQPDRMIPLAEPSSRPLQPILSA